MFLDSLRSPDGKFPEKLEEDVLRPALVARFRMARLYSRLICSLPSAQLENLNASLHNYMYEETGARRGSRGATPASPPFLPFQVHHPVLRAAPRGGSRCGDGAGAQQGDGGAAPFQNQPAESENGGKQLSSRTLRPFTIVIRTVEAVPASDVFNRALNVSGEMW